MLFTNQKTINKTIKLTGIGLHNGIKADLVIKPAEENFGINFCRVDVDEKDLINANGVYQRLVETQSMKTD